jgi:hypothetical protein
VFVFLLYSTSKADLVFSYLGEGGDSWRGRGTSPPFLPTRLTELLQGQSSVSNTVTLQWESLIHSDSVPTLSILVSSRNYTPTEGSAGIFIIYKWQECNLLGTVWCVSWCPWYLARHRTLEKELKRASLNSGISGGVVPCLQVHQAVLVSGFLQHNTPERCSATRTPTPPPRVTADLLHFGLMRTGSCNLTALCKQLGNTRDQVGSRALLSVNRIATVSQPQSFSLRKFVFRWILPVLSPYQTSSQNHWMKDPLSVTSSDPILWMHASAAFFHTPNRPEVAAHQPSFKSLVTELPLQGVLVLQALVSWCLGLLRLHCHERVNTVWPDNPK